MEQSQRIETLIIGGGQAGLATSYCLAQRGHEHLVLEQADRPAHVWHTDRWDSFTLVTPNWSIRMPGAIYTGDDPDGYLPREQLTACFDRYVTEHHLPIRYGVRVTAVVPDSNRDDRPEYRIYAEARDGEPLTFLAAHVVVATGLFQRPKISAFSADLSADILQLHSGAYRNPAALPNGAVLVLGSAQSGCQIAEELYQSGRTVYLATGSAGRVPRSYRGKDMYTWLHETGFLARPADQLPPSRPKFAGNPQLSGKAGGHSLNLHQFARDGVTLLGRVRGADESSMTFAPDLHENLARADNFGTDLLKMVDDYVARTGLDAPADARDDPPSQLRDGFAAEQRISLDLRAAGIHTIIWAMGYTFDFSLIKLPVLDGDGFPIQSRGVTAHPGLYFVGMPWLPSQQTGLLLGVGEHAEYIAFAITQGVAPH